MPDRELTDDTIVIDRVVEAPVELVWTMWTVPRVYTEAMADSNGNVLSAAEAGVPDRPPTFTEVRVQLTDLGGRTGMTLTHIGVPADSPGATRWQMALDKLAAHASSTDVP